MTPEQVDRLTKEYHIYMTRNGRIRYNYSVTKFKPNAPMFLYKFIISHLIFFPHLFFLPLVCAVWLELLLEMLVTWQTLFMR